MRCLSPVFGSGLFLILYPSNHMSNKKILLNGYLLNLYMESRNRPVPC